MRHTSPSTSPLSALPTTLKRTNKRRSHGPFTMACTLGLALISSGALAQASQIRTTADNQILVELAPDDTAPANLFDLNERTLVFTPDGHGGYSRAVGSVVWEDDIGLTVADGAEIQIQNFTFDFASRRWGSFFVSQRGLITFSEPLNFSSRGHRFDPLSEMVGTLEKTAKISVLFKPTLRSQLYVASFPDRTVVTWITKDSGIYFKHGIPPKRPSRFQAVLSANGQIAFSYVDISLGDGIVGLISGDKFAKGRLLARIADGTDASLSGHLDLLDTSIYASMNTDALILEFTLREDIPSPQDGDVYSYRVYFDADEPYLDRPRYSSDLDFYWAVDVRPSGARRVWARGRGEVQILPGEANNRVGLVVENDKGSPPIRAAVYASATHWVNGSSGEQDHSGITLVDLPGTSNATEIDLSQSDTRLTSQQSEVFRYRSVPDLDAIICGVVDTLGDEFDLFVFHSEFRLDVQSPLTPWNPYPENTNVQGIGHVPVFSPPCGTRRLKGRWSLPVWIGSSAVVDHSLDERTRFDRGLRLLAHEFSHSWTAHLTYLRDGVAEPLFGSDCQCHWREDLHLPAAFPWHPEGRGPRSHMGGGYWRENGDGTFTRRDHAYWHENADGTFTPRSGYQNGGHSWLDLYAMGLADASEVPDMFIVQNLQPVNASAPKGPHTGDKEIVSIAQIVAAEGTRIPSAGDAQKDFNAAFVYLLEPGQGADAEMLRLHADYRDKVVEYWSHVTGGRSRITTIVPPLASASLTQ